MPAVAITDAANLFALVKFYRAAQRQGIKAICGADVQVQGEAADQPSVTLTLLVQNTTGYHNLTRLLSKGFLEGQIQGRPTLRREWIENFSE